MAEYRTNDNRNDSSLRVAAPGSGPGNNRWSAKPAGTWALQMLGLAAALALGYGIGQGTSRTDGAQTRVAADSSRLVTQRSRTDLRDQQVAELTQQNAHLAQQTADLARRAEEAEADARIAEIEWDIETSDLRRQNEQLKKAALVFRESRRIVLPRTPLPLQIRVPQATVVAIKQGAKEGVVPDGQGGFVVVRKPSPSVTDALLHGLKKPPQVAALSSAELTRGGKPIELVSPLATVLRPGPVTLRWIKVPGAIGYSVQLQDEKSADVLGKEGEKVSASETPFGVEWTTKPLGAGTYRWQVTALMPEGTAPRVLTAAGKPASFAVLDVRRSADLKAAEAEFAGNQLELGVRYARMGLLDDAEAALIPFVAAYPDSPQTKRLLEQVRSWRNFRSGKQF